MTAAAILKGLLDRGIEPTLLPDESGFSIPPGKLTDRDRRAINAHKAELIERIRESARITTELLNAAMRACDHHGDGAEAREEMKRQCLGTPPHLRADLLAHFQREYPE